MKLGIIIVIVIVIFIIIIGVLAFILLQPTVDVASPAPTATPVMPAVQAKPSAAQAKPSAASTPFSGPTNQVTPWNELGSGTAYLDRHDINCNGKALSGLQFVNKGDGNFHYEYKCSSGGELQGPVDKSTPLNEWGGGNPIYLDRHDIDCGAESVLTQMALKTDNGQIQYKYKCAPAKKNLTCRDVATTMNDSGGNDMRYLDRHAIKCNDNEALSKVRFVNGDGGKSLQYAYRCCA
jgi:hypothetical protein